MAVGTTSLNGEIAEFADSLPYWAKYLCSKLFEGNPVSDDNLNTSYSYFLEDAGLSAPTKRPDICISCSYPSHGDYKADLSLVSLQQIKGVNALIEDQKIAFHPKLTIIYGVNGSGKSGYIRLLKKAFHSRTPEEILPNIHLAQGEQKAISANVCFKSGTEEYLRAFPDDVAQPEFRQLSIFDNKSVNIHLTKKNEFVFRPAGLDFFAALIEVMKRIEEKIDNAVLLKSTTKDYKSLFDGESEIKTALSNISSVTNVAELKKYIPFTAADKQLRVELEEQKAQLLTQKKDDEIAKFNQYAQLLIKLKASILKLNSYFTEEFLAKVSLSIKDYLAKEEKARQDGVDNFKTDKIRDVGNPEWKALIEAAQAFALLQNLDDTEYPDDGDYCILCQQPLSEEALKLIKSYWTFIKSEAELEAKTAQGVLTKLRAEYAGLDFNLLPEDSILTKWLETVKDWLPSLQNGLAAQKALSVAVLSDIDTKQLHTQPASQIGTEIIDKILGMIEIKIGKLKAEDPSVEIAKLQSSIVFLNHREKLEEHIAGIETYISNLKWASAATKAKGKISRRKVTDKGKELSGKYFNDAYAQAFNDECKALYCSVGVDINHTGGDGTSYRQLFLKGLQPTQILSEGEQKIISLADFLAEMKLSDITRGVIFDDPVTSLDNERKARIALRIIQEAAQKQVVVFTHDLVFVSNLICLCEDMPVDYVCHWIEKRGDIPGYVYLESSPSYEKQYRNAEVPRKHYTSANKADCPPGDRESYIKTGFTALRTCYEVLVINDLFKNVVKRFDERVSVESLKDVCFDDGLVTELLDNFGLCCRHMEGHTHSDQYAYQKPTIENLNVEINRYDEIRGKIKKAKKANTQ